MVNQVNQVNTRINNAQIQQAAKKSEIGLIGHIFGDVKEKPGNIAAAAMFMGFIGIVIAAVFVPVGASQSSLFTLFGGIITATVGFVFGRTTS